MSFLPAFTPIYSGALISIPTPTVVNGALPPNSQVQDDKKKVVDPFDPEAAVPLPFQLDDCLGPYGTSVWKRNERERYRVRCVNEGYEKLRQRLPLSDGDKRISKVDTLRLAIRYIKHLEQMMKNEQHMFRCRCFHGFKEESEGNIQVDVRQL